MPVGPYPTFAACVAAQTGKGHDEESARRICGAIERDTRAAHEAALAELDAWIIESARARAKATLDSIERDTEREVGGFFAEQGRVFWREWRRQPDMAFTEPARMRWEEPFDRAVARTAKRLERALTRNLKRAYDAGQSFAYGVIERPTQDDFGSRNVRAEQWIARHGAELVTGINKTTRDELRTIIERGAREGRSPDRIAREITERFDRYHGNFPFSTPMPQRHIRNRAHLIAVTETGTAYSEANYEVARGLSERGVPMEKAWITANDHLVDEQVCAPNQREGWLPLDQPYQSGHMLPLGHPGCRCDQLYRAAPMTTAPADLVADLQRTADRAQAQMRGEALVEHYGPGPHKNGTPQSVHGGGSEKQWGQTVTRQQRIENFIDRNDVIWPEQHELGDFESYGDAWIAPDGTIVDAHGDHEGTINRGQIASYATAEKLGLLRVGDWEFELTYRHPRITDAQIDALRSLGVSHGEYYLDPKRVQYNDPSYTTISIGQIHHAQREAEAVVANLTEHYGPGVHPGTGTPQSIHSKYGPDYRLMDRQLSQVGEEVSAGELRAGYGDHSSGFGGLAAWLAPSGRAYAIPPYSTHGDTLRDLGYGDGGMYDFVSDTGVIRLRMTDAEDALTTGRSITAEQVSFLRQLRLGSKLTWEVVDDGEVSVGGEGLSSLLRVLQYEDAHTRMLARIGQEEAISEHLGPGAHPNGTPQSVHGHHQPAPEAGSRKGLLNRFVNGGYTPQGKRVRGNKDRIIRPEDYAAGRTKYGGALVTPDGTVVGVLGLFDHERTLDRGGLGLTENPGWGDWNLAAKLGLVRVQGFEKGEVSSSNPRLTDSQIEALQTMGIDYIEVFDDESGNWRTVSIHSINDVLHEAAIADSDVLVQEDWVRGYVQRRKRGDVSVRAYWRRGPDVPGLVKVNPHDLPNLSGEAMQTTVGRIKREHLALMLTGNGALYGPAEDTHPTHEAIHGRLDALPYEFGEPPTTSWTRRQIEGRIEVQPWIGNVSIWGTPTPPQMDMLFMLQPKMRTFRWRTYGVRGTGGVIIEAAGDDFDSMLAHLSHEGHRGFFHGEVIEHGGPGPHKNGSPQSVHGGGPDTSYRQSWRPADDGPPLHDLTLGGMIPKDIYEHPEWYGGDSSGDSDYARATRESIAQVFRARGRPDAQVRIYRAAPPEAKAIHPGDWVTLSPMYARMHAARSDDPKQDWPVISKVVPASEIRWDMNDLNEWGWWPANYREAWLEEATLVQDYMRRIAGRLTHVRGYSREERPPQPDVANAAIADWERAHRDDDTESGVIVAPDGTMMALPGEKYSVSVSDEARALMQGAVVMHNHPKGAGKGGEEAGIEVDDVALGPSMNDVLTLKRSHAAEMRIVRQNDATTVLRLTEQGAALPFNRFLDMTLGVQMYLRAGVKRDIDAAPDLKQQIMSVSNDVFAYVMQERGVLTAEGLRDPSALRELMGRWFRS